MLYRYILTLSVAVAGVSLKSYADDLAVKFSGFATLALSYSDDPDIGFRSNYLNDSETGWSLERDSILGGQANISLTEDWDSVVQVVLQDRESHSFENYLELAFLRYRPNRNWAVRAGRLNSDLYLLSEYPSVGYAYLWARPPHEYYSFASTVRSYDGFDVEYNQDIADGYLRIKLAGGKATAKLGVGNEAFAVTFNDLFTLNAVYTKNAWTFRASTSKANAEKFESVPLESLLLGLDSIPAALWPQASQLSRGLNSAGYKITYSAVGLAYDNDNWIVQSELGTAHTKWRLAPSSITGYLSVGYRFDDVTYYTGASFAKSEDDPMEVLTPELPEYLPEELRLGILQLVDVSRTAVQRAGVEQHSFNIGAKWYISDKIVVKAQLDHFVIQAMGGGLWDINTQSDIDSQHHINLFSLSSSLVF